MKRYDIIYQELVAKAEALSLTPKPERLGRMGVLEAGQQIKLACSILERIPMRVDRSECWEWLGAIKADHPYGTLKSPSGVTRRAHRLVYGLLIESVANNMWVLHRCDNPPCVNPFHLFVGTPADNAHDRDLKGRANTPRGEGRKRGVLSDSLVIRFREMCRRGFTAFQIAESFGYRYTTIWNAVNGLTWKHLPMPETRP